MRELATELLAVERQIDYLSHINPSNAREAKEKFLADGTLAPPRSFPDYFRGVGGTPQ